MSEQRIALVTGTSSGIGRQTALLLADRGFQVFATTRTTDSRISDLRAIKSVRLDVRDEDSVRLCLRQVLKSAGRLDLLVNAAGVLLQGAVEETGIDEARAVFERNSFGVLRLCRAALPVMRAQRSGRIINISSVLGFLPGPYTGVYAASKHAVEGFSESLDHEVRQFGIRVSVVEPGFTRTRLAANGELTGQRLPAYRAEGTLAQEAVRGAIAAGDDPRTVASVVLQAATSPHPRLRYAAGRTAGALSLLRRFAPAPFLDRGLRKQLGLPPIAASR